ncbi:hypothetical protein [Pedobacter sp. UYP1]|uniref:hypothetical protein n=1 Tax=Pedobacter sp. UYP1 TaxID=1756396 RepID=UPI0033971C90
MAGIYSGLFYALKANLICKSTAIHAFGNFVTHDIFKSYKYLIGVILDVPGFHGESMGEFIPLCTAFPGLRSSPSATKTVFQFSSWLGNSPLV